MGPGQRVVPLSLSVVPPTCYCASMDLIATIGLPASGKTTWAKGIVSRSGGAVKRINRDDLRCMVDVGVWSEENEVTIIAARDVILGCFLGRGFSVVCDDTNFHPSCIAALEGFAVIYGARFLIRDFRSVPLDECIRRDASREVGHVGEAVIRKMHETYLA